MRYLHSGNCTLLLARFYWRLIGPTTSIKAWIFDIQQISVHFAAILKRRMTECWMFDTFATKAGVFRNVPDTARMAWYIFLSIFLSYDVIFPTL